MSSAPPKKTESALAIAAAAFEEELLHYEAAVEAGRAVRITSDASLQDARRALETCTVAEQRLGANLRAFVSAMEGVQARHRACSESTMKAAKHIQARVGQRDVLLERFAALGNLARDINAPVAAVISDAARSAAPAEILASLQDATSRTDTAIAEAGAVTLAAREADWTDIADEADALRRELEGVRDKVLSASRTIATRAPS